MKLKGERGVNSIAISYLSLTLRQGSIDSSFAAILATQPCVTLFRYTIGVLPINYIYQKKFTHISKKFKKVLKLVESE